MNPGMKMMLMKEAADRNRDNQYNGTYNVDIGTYNGGSEMRRRRDERYMNGDNDTEIRYYGEYPESRFRDRRGREHYDNGRYAPMRNMQEDVQYPRMSNRPMGFMSESATRGESDYRGYEQNSMDERMDLDQVTAEQWARILPKEDGSKGPKWSKEQVRPYMTQVGYNGPGYKFWIVMNALYSDYCKVAKKYGVDRPEYFAELAKAWLEDKDAVPDKAGAYFWHIVKH